MHSVLVADDHPVYRAGMRQLVDAQPGFKVIAEAGSGVEANDFLAQHHTDIALLDISMPGMNGMELLTQLRLQGRRTQCIVVTMYDFPAYATKAIEAGASGYVLKSDDDSVLINCLQRVAEGEKYITPTLEQLLNDPAVGVTSVGSKLNDIQLARLSQREREIMLLISHSKTSRDIAGSLSVSVRTVQNHRSNICKKLGLRGANTLLKLAIDNQDILKL